MSSRGYKNIATITPLSKENCSFREMFGMNILLLLLLLINRVVANYLIWMVVMGKVSSLSKEFRDARSEYYSKVYGATSEPARWRTCVSFAGGSMIFATGRMYVEKEFAGDSKTNVRIIIILY